MLRSTNQKKKGAREYFVGEFKKMLTENLNDYEANFEKYTK